MFLLSQTSLEAPLKLPWSSPRSGMLNHWNIFHQRKTTCPCTNFSKVCSIVKTYKIHAEYCKRKKENDCSRNAIWSQFELVSLITVSNTITEKLSSEKIWRKCWTVKIPQNSLKSHRPKEISRKKLHKGKKITGLGMSCLENEVFYRGDGFFLRPRSLCN